MFLFFKRKAKNENVNTKVKDRSEEINKQYDAFRGDVGVMPFDEDLKNGKKKKVRKGEGNVRTKKKKKETLWQKILRIISPGSIPKTAQDSIPYKRVYPNGVIELPDHIFAKAYRLTDTNFKDNRQDLQEEQFLSFGDLLNYFTPDVRPQFVIFNRAVEKEKFKENILFKEKDDSYNVLRKDFNNILMSKIQEGQNNITQEKYLVISVRAENIEIANNTFSRVDGEVSQRLKVINEANTEPMTLEEWLELLYNIYNTDTEGDFNKEGEINGTPAKQFTMEWMLAQGLTTKDEIAPAYLEFKNSTYFRVGDRVGCALFLRALPTQLSAEIFTDISSVPCTALTSVHLEPCKQDEAIKMVRNQMLEVTRNMSESAKKLAKVGLSTEFISPDQAQEKIDANKFYADLTERDQKSFLLTLIVTIIADDLDELDKYTAMVQNKAETPHLCKLTKLSGQQEDGFNACLPLGYNKLSVNRMLNTESAALFIPFSSQELIQPGGLYYGINNVSHNLIMFNRLEAQNANGLIIGQSGSGKSFQAKAEMLQVFLKSEKNEIFVIDPQAEYRPLCEALGGQVVRIAPSSETHCNPFDLDLSDDIGGDDPITVKSNYICSICESAIGGKAGLSEIAITIIDRCVRLLYNDYLEHMKQLRESGSTITCDRDACPTLEDFYYLLAKQPEPEAEYLSLAMEKYCIGSFNTFAHKTNIDTNNRFVVYDIRDIGTGMSEMGMQVCLNDIWSRTIQNKKRGVRTWIYIDELYVLTQSESCARFLMYIYKQIRKFGGAPTGITQNVEDLLTNRESRGIINNCSFIMLLNQSQEDRTEIGAMLHISDAQLNYIKNADSGQGLIYTGKAIIPFTNRYQNRTSTLYKTISTNVSDMVNYGG